MDGIMNKVGRKGAFSNKKDTVESITKLMERGGLMSAGIDDEISKFKVTKDVIKRWGEKYDKADLYFLENQYNELLDTFSGTTPIEKNLYMHYSLNELAIRKAREAGDQKTVNQMRYWLECLLRALLKMHHSLLKTVNGLIQMVLEN